MQLYNLTPIKSLGQNFLIDKNLANKIVNQLDSINNKNVIEIGPGMGALTDILLSKNANVFAIDKDTRAVEYLTKKYKNNKNFTILNSDIRTVDLNLLNIKDLLVIGNIPYNISTDILFWLFDFNNIINKVVLTVQREVAERLCAKYKTKTYGITTIATQLYGTPKIMFNIPSSAFYPAPKVTSSVLKIEFNNVYNNINKKQILSLVKASFSHRRKKINNSIKQYLLNNKVNTVKLNEELNKKKFAIFNKTCGRINC